MQFCVPAQCAVADVVRRGDASGFARAFVRHAAGMAAVEDGGEVAVVGELAVEVEELFVGDGVLGRPVEVVGGEAFVHAVGFVGGAVNGHLRAVTGIEQHARVAGFHIVQQPVQAIHDACGGGAFVEDDADVFRREAAFL